MGRLSQAATRASSVLGVANGAMIENDTVSVVTGLTAIATLCLVIVASVQLHLLRKSIDESARTRSASVLLSIYEMMQDLRPSWLELYAYPDDFRRWDPDQRALADRVGVGLQLVAYLCLVGLLDKRYVRDAWAGTFVNCWRKLEDYVRNYRVQCGEPPEVVGLQQANQNHPQLFHSLGAT